MQLLTDTHTLLQTMGYKCLLSPASEEQLSDIVFISLEWSKQELVFHISCLDPWLNDETVACPLIQLFLHLPVEPCDAIGRKIELAKFLHQLNPLLVNGALGIDEHDGVYYQYRFPAGLDFQSVHLVQILRETLFFLENFYPYVQLLVQGQLNSEQARLKLEQELIAQVQSRPN